MASINLQGDTSGSISISAPSVAGSNTLTLPATTQTLATQNALGVRNLIINGDMKIAQRGTSSTGQTTGGYKTCDRWWNNIASGGTWTISQDTDVPTGQGFANSLKMQCTTADASLTGIVQVYQKIEAQNLQHLKFGTSSAETTTFSFWIKSNKTGTYIYEIYQADSARSISKSFTIDSANTWEKKTITVVGDTSGVINNDNGEGYRATIWLAAGTTYTSGTLQTSWDTLVNANRAVGQVNLADSTSNYINITGVQLEVGDTATPFEHRPYDMELARCQRYCYRFTKSGNSNSIGTFVAWSTTNSYGPIVTFPQIMRASPTMTISSLSDFWVSSQGTNQTPTAFSAIGTYPDGASAIMSGTSFTPGYAIWSRFNNDAVTGNQYIQFDAEL